MLKPTVLVVEDESALVTLLRYNLEREGYRVLEARDGEEALLVSSEEKPDVVLLDWMLPQLSGDAQRPHHHADGARRGNRPRTRTRSRRRRLHHQAVLHDRAGGPAARG